MHVAQDASGYTDREDSQVSPGLVSHTARNVDHNPSVEFDLLIVEDHAPLAADYVVKLVGPLVVVQLGIVDFDVVNFAGSAVLLLDQATNLSAGLCPRLYLGRIST
jgi:hypothetical protein